MSIRSILKKNKESALLLTSTIILPFIASSVFLSLIIKYQDQMMLFTKTDWALFYLGASLCMAMALTHTTFIALLSGYFLGWNCILYVIVSYLAASVMGYYLAKKLDNGKLLQSLIQSPKARVIADDLKSNELKIIILSRLSPVLPFAMMNVFLSLLNANLTKYLLGSFIGMLPRTLLFIWTGSEARNLLEAFKKGSPNDLVSLSIPFLLILSLLGLFYYVLHAVKKGNKLPK